MSGQAQTRPGRVGWVLPGAAAGPDGPMLLLPTGPLPGATMGPVVVVVGLWVDGSLLLRTGLLTGLLVVGMFWAQGRVLLGPDGTKPGPDGLTGPRGPVLHTPLSGRWPAAVAVPAAAAAAAAR